MFVMAVSRDDIREWGDADTPNEVTFARLLGWMANMGCGEDLTLPLFAAPSVEECKRDIKEYCNDNDCTDEISNVALFKIEEIPA